MSASTGLVLRSNNTKNEKYHAKIGIEKIPVEQPCVIVLGGNGNRKPEDANGSAKHIREDIIEPYFVNRGKPDIPVYSVFYEFDKEDSNGDNWNLRDNVGLYEMEKSKYKTFVFDFDTKDYELNVFFKNLFIKNGFRTSISEWDSSLVRLTIERGAEKIFYQKLSGFLSYIGYYDEEIEYILSKIIKRQKDSHSEHIGLLFDTIVKPRIVENNKRLSLEEALHRMRMVTIYAHCYGGFVAKKLQERTKKEMINLGYSYEETEVFLNQMLIVAHAPRIRFHHQTDNYISFMSAQDGQIDIPNPRGVNNLADYMHKLSEYGFSRVARGTEADRDKDLEWIKPFKYVVNGQEVINEHIAYFSKKYGNFFLIPRGYEYEGIEFDEHYVSAYEHNYLRHNDNLVPEQKPEGRILNILEKMVLINGINNSLMQIESNEYVSLPDISKLIFGEKSNPAITKQIFDSMKSNGNKLVIDSIIARKEELERNQAKKETQIIKPQNIQRR